jgi:hypothetical protein
MIVMPVDVAAVDEHAVARKILGIVGLPGR